MKRFIQGEDRNQATLLPELLDDYVAETNPVRVVDVFVDELDLGQLGFEGIEPAETGRPAYHPAVLLRIYIYGYLNRIQSSRRLEREAQRNVELMWLTGRLMPDFKTIANFRKDNSKAIRSVCKQFVMLCQRLGLFTEALVAIDGSKFKAVNNRDRNFTSAKLKHRMEEIESSISRYLAAIETADRQEASIAEVRTERLQDKIESLKAQMRELKEVEVQLKDAPDHQLSLTDPDARSMKSRGNGIVGYNVQTAVDAKHHLIVAHEVTTEGSDHDQLLSMSLKAQESMGTETVTAVADRGYFKSKEILACENAGVEVYVARPEKSSGMVEGRFCLADFIYDADKDEYRCPAGKALIWRFDSVEKGLKMHCYWSSNCKSCAIKSQCTGSTERRIKRWEDEAVLESMQKRLDQAPNIMRTRRQTVEHPFGTIKLWMGAAHFLTTTLEKVSTEMSLHVLAYNMKRVMQIMGTTRLMEAMKA